MKQIEPLYVNEIGMAFFWCEPEGVASDKVQMVFKETGFYFSREELMQFLVLIDETCYRNQTCGSCQVKAQCHKLLLKTPVSQIDLAVSMHELEHIKDLVEGAIFKAQLHDFVFGAGMN